MRFGQLFSFTSHGYKTFSGIMLLLIMIVSLNVFTFVSGREVLLEPYAKAQINNHQNSVFARAKRAPNQAEEKEGSGEHRSEGANGEEGKAEAEADPAEKSDISLGKILGIVFVACCILYCIGIGIKIFKIFKGTYVEEEPVFLKYK